MEGWTFLTNHSHVLLSIANDPEIRLRDIAQNVGITERAAQRIVADLIEGGYLTSAKVGRRNHYTLNPERGLRHPIEQHCRIGSLLSLVNSSNSAVVEPVRPVSHDDRHSQNGQQVHVGRRAGTMAQPQHKKGRSV
jgi:predicted transcriptional regulator